MTDEEMADAVRALVHEALGRLFERPGARAHLDAFMRGDAAYIVTRAEVAVAVPPPPQVRTDLGLSN